MRADSLAMEKIGIKDWRAGSGKVPSPQIPVCTNRVCYGAGWELEEKCLGLFGFRSLKV